MPDTIEGDQAGREEYGAVHSVSALNVSAVHSTVRQALNLALIHPSLLFSASATFAGTKPLTSPPKPAISLTNEEEM